MDAVPWSLPEVRIVAIYILLASAWILGSDQLLAQLGWGDSESVALQSLKGLNFVVTTALVLLLVLRRAYGGWRRAEARRVAAIVHARERFRDLWKRTQALQEEDRTRISREIHDELGQLLTGLKMEIRLLENRLSARDDRSLNTTIDKLIEISALVDQTISSVQTIASDLRPSALDNLGLGTALIDEAAQFFQRTGIPCAVVVDDFPTPVPLEVTTTAYRIFQESLTNIARHSQAHRVDVKLRYDAEQLRLAIHDDGCGIDPAAVHDSKSLGLIGMIERAQHVGDHVEITPCSTKGTDIIVTLPLAAAAAKPLPSPAAS